MNILVTGANGQLGSEMRIVSRDTDKDTYIFSDINDVEGAETLHLDITDIQSIRKAVRENNIECIVNCAAYTNVDGAEDNIDLCRTLNADAPRNLAIAMKEVDGMLVHISTDYVFGADPYNTPCKEDQKGTPSGIYGLTKLEGEQAILESGCHYIIIRTAWLYSEFGKNFVKTMLTLTETKPQLKVVFDQCGTPTYALDLASVIYDILQNRKYDDNWGIYHYSNEGVCSWFDFTKMIARLSGNDKCDIQPCHSNEFPSKVTRPSYSVFDKTKIKETFKIEIPYWVDSLEVCLEKMKREIDSVV